MSRNYQKSDDFRREEQRMSQRLDQDAAQAKHPGCWCSGDYSEFEKDHTPTCPYRIYLRSPFDRAIKEDWNND